VYSRDVLRELDDGSGIAGGYRAHAHFVLIVRLGGAGEDARRVGDLERLGCHRRAAELHPLETVVQARLGAVLVAERDQVRSQARVELLVHDQLELPVHQVAEVGYGDL
jgi:hypothetical protein